ncbi:MAG: histidine ammonia-lyase [bacterium]|nr:histidine ammonia-lyase [bacterium]
MKILELTGDNLTLENIEEVARGFRRVKLSVKAISNVKKSRKIVKDCVEGEDTYYGLNTGFGDLCDVKISNKDIRKLQSNLIRSHSVGVGDYLSKEVVRAVMLIRINTLIQGNSGVRLKLVQLLVDFLNKGVHPAIPSKGSVGSSGDLAPLAHMSLPLIGEGEVFIDDKLVDAKLALKKFGLKPIELRAKEGLALINGTAVMCAVGVLALLDAEALVKMADISGAMSLEALKGVDAFLRKEIHEMRPHRGQIDSASNMRKLIKGSGILAEYRDSGKVQDAYSVRCMPQVHGASKDSFSHVRKVLEIEVNSVTDNPLVILKTGEILSGGNFHGQPIAFVMDFLGIALAEVANIAESRVSRLINSRYSDLPPFLVQDSGLNSGFMVAQYTVAALVSENKILCHPASVDSIPTCAGQEDHVSMGTIAARKAREIVKNVTNVIAIEFMAATQGLDFLDPLRSSKPLEAVRKVIRKDVRNLKVDRRMDMDIATVVELMKSGKIIETVERIVGVLQ